MDDFKGRKLGNYTILRLIGKGGMSSVYLAEQESIGRQVALKVLPAHFLHEDTFLKRFQREVQAIALMQHPHILPVHDYGEHEGIPYIAMAYIDGGSLDDAIHYQGTLPLDETVRIVDQIAEGLDYAHEKGVVHRDFKPSNVLLDRRGNAYLADFGIAKVSQETSRLTGSGIVGTPVFMAPEMYRDNVTTQLVDIYALGVTLFMMLGGKTPYEGDTPVRLMYAHLNEPVPEIRSLRADLPEGVQMVIETAMAKEPGDRYPTAADLAADLREVLDMKQPSRRPTNSRPVVAVTAQAEDGRTERIDLDDMQSAPVRQKRDWRRILTIAVAVYVYVLNLLVFFIVVVRGGG